MVNDLPVVVSLIDSLNSFEPAYWTEAVIESPGLIVMEMVSDGPGYISHHTEYWATPFDTSCSVPSCSTELLL